MPIRKDVEWIFVAITWFLPRVRTLQWHDPQDYQLAQQMTNDILKCDYTKYTLINRMLNVCVKY